MYPRTFKAAVKAAGWVGRLVRAVDIDDQVEACRRVFASDTRWTVVRGSDLEEGESQGLPVWSKHVGDPILQSNITRRVDFALFMVEALENDDLVHEAPAIVGCQTPSALILKRFVQEIPYGFIKIKCMPVAGLDYKGMRRPNFSHFPIKKKCLFWRNSSITIPMNSQNGGRSRLYIFNWTGFSKQFRLGF